MRTRYVIGLSLLALSYGALGQVVKDKKEQYVVAPPENILLVVASQPDCPLLIEQATLLLPTEPHGQVRFRYRVKNVSEKAIRSYTIAELVSNGTGGTLGDGRPLDKLLVPGADKQSDESDCEVVMLTRQIKDKLGLRDKLKRISILIVQSVRFEDGTTFSAETTSTAILRFFEEKEN